MAKTRQQLRQEQRKKKDCKENNTQKAIIAAISIVLIVAVALIIFFAFGKSNSKVDDISSNKTNQTELESNGNEKTEYHNVPQVEGEHEKVRFTMENGEKFVVELYPEYAPETVENFKNLVESGFYNGVTFHRIVDGFMAQGGDPTGTGMGGSSQTVKGEFASNGFKDNLLSHQRGVISMARSQDPDSASSQFFICYGDESFLDGNYAAFGKVVDGMETIDNFLKVERDVNEMGEEAIPKTPIVIKKAELIK